MGYVWLAILECRQIVKNYFLEKASPFNIAVFRIIFYSYILVNLNAHQILWYSYLPKELQIAPVGMGGMLSFIPINPYIAAKALVAFNIFCLLAMIGCFARGASFLAAICGIYVLGIPNFYGKVDHNQIFLVWFMFIFSVSKCSDVLSIDAIFKRIRGADQGVASKNTHSIEYALPLRFMWLLMAIIYLFPGAWKLIHCHFQWAFSDNLKYQLYNKWFELGGWVPVFRIDQHPWLCRVSAFGVMCFELSFIFFIFLPSLRWMVLLGLLFHGLISFFMKIDFSALQMCYLSFIDWGGLFGKFKNYGISTKIPSKQSSNKNSFEIKILKFTGFLLLSINLIFGLREISSGWPFACFPTFDHLISEPRIETLTFFGFKNGKEERINMDGIRERMSSERFHGMLVSILETKDEKFLMDRLKAVITVMKSEGIDLRKYPMIRIYRTVCSTLPEKAKDYIISRKLLAEINI